MGIKRQNRACNRGVVSELEVQIRTFCEEDMSSYQVIWAK